ncbi:hypothetical protein N7448_001931 [Penicillium atrosanguineum]|uniref:Uncharacterized protein n=1 Tax=Penicillium atrosanguineum TaxID=1132637 RepID=A0A9W9HCN5_9EURO|nr:uncharacterized protein N7443_005332 [Penicillium atrosanguineum]KAJ5144539.1 hypothetical protein N7448_001931 [Penicillium atrosanguineum]KAJ5300330.1 hypothetical protein N7443_005332 [Penicillium atrosanguineum]KAJ5310970.1 hypothetical protein N7476_006830 [Penicillium atrosanguineum]
MKRLRSGPKEPPVLEKKTRSLQEIDEPVHFIVSDSSPADPVIARNQPRLLGLAGADLQLLRKKQHRLRASASLTVENSLEFGWQAIRALASTLIFAQHEAGSAICIDPRGWILTCAHCFGETSYEWKAGRRKWLLYYNGLAVQVECRAWDERRDLALAKIIRIETSEKHSSPVRPVFTFVPVAQTLKTSAHILCIGQPGADDLESAVPRQTAYNLIEISQGRLCGMVSGADPEDNSDIGTLKHNAWTYWGHSGAPLLRRSDGALLGLHSSWDDTTAMRHGVPLVAIQSFLKTHLPSELVDLTAESCRDENREIITIDCSD